MERMPPMKAAHPRIGVSENASSTEFVGEFWLRKIAECVIEGDFNGRVGAKAVRFSHRQFCFVVETFDRACRNRALGPKPIEDQVAMFSQTRATFFIGSILLRIVRVHH